jgi:biopolymer transport protein ExbD
MEIRFVCAHCGKKLSASPDHVGKRARCPRCQELFVVPPAETAAASPTQTQDAGEARRPRVPKKEKPRPLFPKRVEGPDHELIDMTAMVDIVFFLLIFFMVTSMHSLQSSISLPTPEAEAEQGTRRAPQSGDDDQVVVQIDPDDTVSVNGEDARSRQELISQLRNAESTNLLVMASGEAMHGTVVMVLDAGSDAGMQQIRLVTEGLDNE